MIDSIRLQNYKGHADTTIPLGRLTVLVGENACGKTSVLELLHRTGEGLPTDLPAELLRRNATALEWTLQAHEGETPISLRAQYTPKAGGDALEAVVREVAPEGARRPRTALIALSPRALAASSAPSTTQPQLGPHGEGLASVLAHLKLTDEARFDRVVARLCAVVPVVKGLRFTRVASSELTTRNVRVEGQLVLVPQAVTSILDALRFNFADADDIPAAQVSEGTLLTLGILTALETADRGPRVVGGEVLAPVSMVLLDDLDRALHPRAQRELIGALRKVLDETPELQIVATTHSPYLVDTLRADEVVVMGRKPDGTLAARRLDTFPDTRLKDMLSTGELWMSEGDAWVAR